MVKQVVAWKWRSNGLINTAMATDQRSYGVTLDIGLLTACRTGPARIESDGTMLWIQAGVYHRDSIKPAIIQSDGVHAYCVKGTLQFERTVTSADFRLAFIGVLLK